MKAQVERRLRHLPVLGEAVKNAADPLRAFLGEQAQGVRRRLPIMYDERLADRHGGPDMRAETFALPFRRVFLPVVIESGFADADDARVLRQCDQVGERRLAHAGRLRMHADRRQQVAMRFGQRQHARIVLEIDADTDGATDAVLLHQLKNLREVFGEIRKIEMAM